MSPDTAPAPSSPSVAAPLTPAPEPPAAPHGWWKSAGARRAGGLALVIGVAASAVYGANLFGIRDRIVPVPKIPTPSAHGVPSGPNGQPVLASEPWWQTVTTLQGSGNSSEAVTIGGGALQWRVDWTCDTGHLSVTGHPAAPSQIVDSACSGKGESIVVSTGAVALQVSASGPWQLRIDQQLDIPLQQTPLPEMTAASAVLTGSFYAVDQNGHGTVTIYRLADGSYALRLDNFFVSPNTGLQIQLSSSAAPHSDSDVSNSQIAVVADLNQTAGSMNFTVPSSVDPTKYHSVAIWCVNLRTVYSAATLSTP